MRIDKIASSEEYRIDKQLQNLPTFGTKFWFFKLTKIEKFVNFSNCEIMEIC